MATIKTYPMPNSTILRINSERDVINISPEYQRKGEIWTLEKKQLLIDSILNDYDIPKLYFHELTPLQKESVQDEAQYAIIDGRQRIEAIWEFLNGDFALDPRFEYLADEKVTAGGFTYLDLATRYPKLKIRFDSFVLPIILVVTEDYDLIEDMFSRLNEAVPLTAAEKRNAFGGSMAKAIRDLSNHILFTKSVRFANTRYQHLEVVARMLFLEDNIIKGNKIIDTKKPYLDKFVREYHDDQEIANELSHRATDILDQMARVFIESDVLLRAQAAMVVYYLVFRSALHMNQQQLLIRARFVDFYKNLEINRKAAEDDIANANYDLLEFDRLSQQGTNDASSIKERVKTMSQFLGIDVVQFS